MENKLYRTNTFKIVGRLLSANVRTGNRKDNGNGYISVDVTMSSVIGGKTKEFEVNFFTNELTADKKPSQLYASYAKLPEMVNKKIEVSGEIRENRYYSSNLGQLISTQQLSGRWVRGVAETSADEATYELGGFVVKTILERQNKEGEIYRYDLTIGQSNFSGTSMSMFTLHVNPNDREIIAGVDAYNAGDTIWVKGVLDFSVEQVTSKVAHEGGFGEPVTRVYTNRQKNFYITGGSAPIDNETTYSPETIKALIDAYKAHDVELTAKTGAVESVAPAASATVTRRQASLI